jgi:hypothetical protein
MRTTQHIRAGLEAEFDRVTVWPKESGDGRQAA